MTVYTNFQDPSDPSLEFSLAKHSFWALVHSWAQLVWGNTTRQLITTSWWNMPRPRGVNGPMIFFWFGMTSGWLPEGSFHMGLYTYIQLYIYTYILYYIYTYLCIYIYTHISIYWEIWEGINFISCWRNDVMTEWWDGDPLRTWCSQSNLEQLHWTEMFPIPNSKSLLKSYMNPLKLLYHSIPSKPTPFQYGEVEHYGSRIIPKRGSACGKAMCNRTAICAIHRCDRIVQWSNKNQVPGQKMTWDSAQQMLMCLLDLPR